MSGIGKLRDTWDALGEDDPLWAVLSTPESRGNRWNLDEFLATGREEVGQLFDRLCGLAIQVQTGRALDFGCGVGRVTQALATRFDRVDGVDIARSMIDLAREHNQHGDRCRYHVNEVQHLRLFGSASFDFVYSRIVLMHMPPRYAKLYITEFARVVKPGGLVVFHVPSSMPVIRRAVYETAVARRRLAEVARPAVTRVKRRVGPTAVTGGRRTPTSYKHAMYFIPRRTVKKILARNAMALLLTEETDTIDVHDVLYYARKRGAAPR